MTAAAGVIYLLRHGQAVEEGPRRFIGQTDRPLTAAGIAQAEAWRGWFARVPLSAIVSSDLQRARETARIVAAAGPAPETIPALREIHLGEWEGLPFEAVRERFPEAFRLRGADPGAFRPPGGESFQDLERRVWPVFQSLAAGRSGPLLIVGHAGVHRVLLCRLLGMPLAHLFRLGQDPGALSILEPRGEAFRLQALNLPPPS